MCKVAAPSASAVVLVTATVPGAAGEVSWPLELNVTLPVAIDVGVPAVPPCRALPSISTL